MRKVYSLKKQRRQRHLKNMTSKNKKVSRLFPLAMGDHQPQKEDAIALSLSPSRSIFWRFDFRAPFFCGGGSVCVCVCVVVSFKITSFFMRKVYLLIINVSTPHGGREFQRKDDWHPKTKKISGLFFFFLMSWGINSLKNSLSPSRDIDVWHRASFLAGGEVCGCFSKEQSFFMRKVCLLTNNASKPLKIGREFKTCDYQKQKSLSSVLFCFVLVIWGGWVGALIHGFELEWRKMVKKLEILLAGLGGGEDAREVCSYSSLRKKVLFLYFELAILFRSYFGYRYACWLGM